MPPDRPPGTPDENAGRYNRLHKDDVELATSSIDTPRAASPAQSLQSISQYDAAKEMINFQSIDIGAHCEIRDHLRKEKEADDTKSSA